jgi:hypothetical protein
MSTVNFPNSPSNGQTLTTNTGITYTYNSAKSRWDATTGYVTASALDNYLQVANASSGSTVTTYSSNTVFPSSGNANGALAFSNSTGDLFVWNGSQWDKIAHGVDESPVIITEPPSTHTLSPTGANTTITMLATDPEGFDVTYGIAYKNAGSTLPSQLLQAPTINHSNGVYTFTPTSNTAAAGNFRARLSASDGVRTTTRLVDFSLGFYIEMLLAGGGGGGNDNAGGGGGAGGLVIDENFIYSAVTYNITVGAGGAAEQGQGDRGNPGGNTTFAYANGTIIYNAMGGGGGGPYPGPDGTGDGGSGGGAGRATTGQEGASLQASYGGKGFGNAGGSSYSNAGGGGGGGAGGAGGNASGGPNVAGDGGAGKASSITGSSVYYSPGGPGYGYNTSPGSYVNGTASSYGAGGAGGLYSTTPPAYDGASGVCIIATTSTPSSLTGTYTANTTARPGFTIYTWTSNGSISFGN